MLGGELDIPADAVLRDVLAALEPQSVLAALRDNLAESAAESGGEFRTIVRLDTVYHPGRYVRMSFALLSDPQTPSDRVWPEGKLIYLHAPVRRPMSRRGEILRLGNHEFELYRFPNDRRLRGLRKFASATLAPMIWQRWVDRDGHSGPLNPETLQRRFIRYAPEYKWIIRLRAEFQDGDAGEIVKRRIAVRCASPSSCSRLARRHAATGEALARQGTAVRVPAVVGLDAPRGLLAVEWDRGEALLDRLKESDGSASLDEFVSALRCLHSAAVEGLPKLTAERLAAASASAIDELSLACGDLAGDLQPLGEELARQLQGIDAPAEVTLHNDLHLRQVHAKRGRTVFLDLERMARGDPLVDVANFAVQLMMLPHRTEMEVGRADADRWTARFLSTWSASTGTSLDPRRFHPYSAFALLKFGHGMMRHLRPGWRKTVRTCVQLADRQLSASQSKATVP